MNLKELRYILAVCETDSLSKAAKKLYISQPALSKFIKNLERTSGITIFNRLGGKLVLSDSGQIYMNAAKMIVDIYENMESEIQDIDSNLKGCIKIGITTFRGTHLLPKVLPKFCEKYPNYEILLFEEDSKVLEDLLSKREVDVIILKLPFIVPDFSYVSLYSEELLISIPRKNPLNKEAIHTKGNKYPWIDLNLLKDEVFILLKSGHRTRAISENILKDARIAPSRIIQTDNIETALKLSIAGLGISFIPELYSINNYNADKPLFFTIGSHKATSEFVIAYRKGEHLNASTKTFIDIVSEYCNRNQIFDGL